MDQAKLLDTEHSVAIDAAPEHRYNDAVSLDDLRRVYKMANHVTAEEAAAAITTTEAGIAWVTNYGRAPYAYQKSGGYTTEPVTIPISTMGSAESGRGPKRQLICFFPFEEAATTQAPAAEPQTEPEKPATPIFRMPKDTPRFRTLKLAHANGSAWVQVEQISTGEKKWVELPRWNTGEEDEAFYDADAAFAPALLPAPTDVHLICPVCRKRAVMGAVSAAIWPTCCRNRKMLRTLP